VDVLGDETALSCCDDDEDEDEDDEDEEEEGGVICMVMCCVEVVGRIRGLNEIGLSLLSSLAVALSVWVVFARASSCARRVCAVCSS
jgi:hypothetical protein